MANEAKGVGTEAKVETEAEEDTAEAKQWQRRRRTIMLVDVKGFVLGEALRNVEPHYS